MLTRVCLHSAVAAATTLVFCGVGSESSVARMSSRVGVRARAPEALPQPDPAAVYAVPITGAPTIGPPDAPVTIVQAYEFACPHSHTMHSELEQLVAARPGQVRVVFKSFLLHPEARRAAEIGCAAGRQGAFPAVARLVYERAFRVEHDLSEANIDRHVAELGLDHERLERDVRACAAQIDRDRVELSAVGTQATPTIYVNGRALRGAVRGDTLRALVDEELEKARAAIAAGTPAQEFYQRHVLDAGRRAL